MIKALTTRTRRTAALMSSKPRLSVAAVGLTAALALAGCSSGASSTGATSPASGSASASASAPASGAASASASASGSGGATTGGATGTSTGMVLTLTEHANTTTVHVPVGGTVLLVLHTTSWGTPHVSDPSVLAPLGLPEVVHSTPCVPGGGCGTQSTRFVARQAGTVTVTDTRTSCGEARRCTGSEGSFSVTVVVG